MYILYIYIHTYIYRYTYIHTDVFCAIWHHLNNFKNMKNTHGVTPLHGCFSRFLNCTNDNKSRNALHISYHIT